MERSTKEALDAAIDLMKPKAKLDDVGAAIQRIIEAYGFVPVENLTGHSMERYKLHAGLSVPNVMGDGSGSVKEGDVIAIELEAGRCVQKNSLCRRWHPSQ